MTWMASGSEGGRGDRIRIQVERGLDGGRPRKTADDTQIHAETTRVSRQPPQRHPPSSVAPQTCMFVDISRASPHSAAKVVRALCVGTCVAHRVC